ncbi:hypothetical protein CM15mP35_03410 [bacterium]|nr:MAG: hypothetical protein CM15mP35_03410 [bacterium]
MQQGILYESMNMAALWKLPVVFCCINNQYGMGTKIDDAVAVKDFSLRAKSFGLECLHVNHLDAEKAYTDIKEIVDNTRNNKPSFIEVECYRFYGHARKDKSPYVMKMKKLKIENLIQLLLQRKYLTQNILNEEEIKSIDMTVDKEWMFL